MPPLTPLFDAILERLGIKLTARDFARNALLYVREFGSRKPLYAEHTATALRKGDTAKLSQIALLEQLDESLTRAEHTTPGVYETIYRPVYEPVPYVSTGATRERPGGTFEAQPIRVPTPEPVGLDFPVEQPQREYGAAGPQQKMFLSSRQTFLLPGQAERQLRPTPDIEPRLDEIISTAEYHLPNVIHDGSVAALETERLKMAASRECLGKQVQSDNASADFIDRAEAEIANLRELEAQNVTSQNRLRRKSALEGTLEGIRRRLEGREPTPPEPEQTALQLSTHTYPLGPSLADAEISAQRGVRGGLAGRKIRSFSAEPDPVGILPTEQQAHAREALASIAHQNSELMHMAMTGESSDPEVRRAFAGVGLRLRDARSAVEVIPDLNAAMVRIMTAEPEAGDRLRDLVFDEARTLGLLPESKLGKTKRNKLMASERGAREKISQAEKAGDEIMAAQHRENLRGIQRDLSADESLTRLERELSDRFYANRKGVTLEAVRNEFEKSGIEFSPEVAERQAWAYALHDLFTRQIASSEFVTRAQRMMGMLRRAAPGQTVGTLGDPTARIALFEVAPLLYEPAPALVSKATRRSAARGVRPYTMDASLFGGPRGMTLRQLTPEEAKSAKVPPRGFIARLTMKQRETASTETLQLPTTVAEGFRTGVNVDRLFTPEGKPLDLVILDHVEVVAQTGQTQTRTLAGRQRGTAPTAKYPAAIVAPLDPSGLPAIDEATIVELAHLKMVRPGTRELIRLSAGGADEIWDSASRGEIIHRAVLASKSTIEGPRTDITGGIYGITLPNGTSTFTLDPIVAEQLLRSSPGARSDLIIGEKSIKDAVEKIAAAAHASQKQKILEQLWTPYAAGQAHIESTAQMKKIFNDILARELTRAGITTRTARIAGRRLGVAPTEDVFADAIARGVSRGGEAAHRGTPIQISAEAMADPAYSSAHEALMVNPRAAASLRRILRQEFKKTPFDITPADAIEHVSRAISGNAQAQELLDTLAKSAMERQLAAQGYSEISEIIASDAIKKFLPNVIARYLPEEFARARGTQALRNLPAARIPSLFEGAMDRIIERYGLVREPGKGPVVHRLSAGLPENWLAFIKRAKGSPDVKAVFANLQSEMHPAVYVIVGENRFGQLRMVYTDLTDGGAIAEMVDPAAKRTAKAIKALDDYAAGLNQEFGPCKLDL